MVGKCPSPMISKLLGGLPWICKNYRYGCREIKIAVEDLEYHQRNCIYRPVFCPRTNCRDKFALFKDVNDYHVTIHQNFYEVDRIIGEANKWKTCFWFPENWDTKPTTWLAGIMTSTDGDLFYDIAYFDGNSFYLWLYFFGGPDEAKKFLCQWSFTISKKRG